MVRPRGLQYQGHKDQSETNTWSVLEGSILIPIMFTILINDLNSGAERTHSESASNTKLERVVATPNLLPFRGTWTGWRTGQRETS